MVVSQIVTLLDLNTLKTRYKPVQKGIFQALVAIIGLSKLVKSDQMWIQNFAMFPVRIEQEAVIAK